MFSSSIPRWRHPAATSDADDDCHIANPRVRAAGSGASRAASDSSMLAQVAAMAVNCVTSCRASASSMTAGLAKLDTTTRVTPLSRVKLVLWMKPSA